MPPAHALKVALAKILSGEVRVIGIQAEKKAPLTWDGTPVGTSSSGGSFNFKTTNLPQDCVGELSDGVNTIDVVVDGCTIVQEGGGEVAATGQTICYNTAGTVIACAGTGQDGDVLAGTPLPSPRFTDNLNGTITDNLTGLIWLKDAECFGARTWAQALSDANTLANGTCGLTDGSSAGDWHLPNRNELASLVHLGFVNPALSDAAGTAKWTNGDAFTDFQSSNYWSATTYATSPTGAWDVFFDDGFVDAVGKTSNSFVLPVRSGP